VQPGKRFYFEDVYPGLVLRSARAITMDRDSITGFARQFDLHPAHLSEETAAESMFGVFCASGWHTGAVTMRLISETMPIARGGMGAGVEALRWIRPVRAGDALRDPGGARLPLASRRRGRDLSLHHAQPARRAGAGVQDDGAVSPPGWVSAPSASSFGSSG